MTRRMLGASVAAVLPGVRVAAAQGPAPDAESELNAARERIRKNLEALRRFPVASATEPSFAFKP